MANTQGITAEKDEFSEWFTQIMLKADLADYSDVSGSIIFHPVKRGFAPSDGVSESIVKLVLEVGFAPT